MGLVHVGDADITHAHDLKEIANILGRRKRALPPTQPCDQLSLVGKESNNMGGKRANGQQKSPGCLWPGRGGVEPGVYGVLLIYLTWCRQAQVQK